MTATAVDPSGRAWRISRRLFMRPRFRGFGRPSGSDAFDAAANGFGLTDGLTGLALAIALIVAVLAIITVWPIILFLIELVIVAAVGGTHAVLGRRLVVAESDREIRSWIVRGQSASARLEARVALALQEGTELPPGDRVEPVAAPAVLSEEDVARRPGSASVRVIARDDQRTDVK
jgi:hypothetical protein